MLSKKLPVVLCAVVLLTAVSGHGYPAAEADAPQPEMQPTTADQPTENRTTTDRQATTAEQTANDSEDGPSEEVIERRVLGNETLVESVTGTVTVESDIGGETRTIRANVWQRPPDRFRFEYVSGPSAGTTFVSNGSTVWFYNETTDTVRRLQYEQGLVQNLTRAFRNLSQGYTAEYLREATVSGRETYVVRVRPPNGTFGDLVRNQTVWVAQENWFPVKTQVTVSVGNTTTTSTTTYSNLTFNESIPDERFSFDPPENATVVEVDPTTTTYDSVAAAEGAVNFSVRSPESLPEGYELENVTVTSSGTTASVSLLYGNGTATLVFGQSPADGATVSGGQNVSVAGNPGRYQEFSGQGILQWQSDGFTYSLTGPLPRETLVGIAESVYNESAS